VIGRQLSHFRITGELGSGGMGVVYRALDLRLNRVVALKLLPPEAAADAGLQERLLREARAASGLAHPNIVTVYEVDSTEGVSFIAMELVEGRRLDELIPAAGLPLDEALAYAVPIAEGLARAHAAGIIHRDLKPRNVMVTPEGVVKLLDFGLAKRVAPQSMASGEETADIVARTRTGALVGTPAYMSPEQAQGRALDARSDVFSFGVLFFEMLSGRRAFQGASVVDVLAAILRDPAPQLRTLRPELPEAVERLVASTLEKDPERRPAGMHLVLQELRRLRAAPGPPTGRAAARRPWRLALGAIAVASVAVAGGVLWLRGRSTLRPTRFRLLSTFPGSHRSPSLSPDGRMVAYIDEAGGAAQVFVKYLDEGEPLQITSGPDAAARPRWSPRGDLILFERRGQGLWVVAPLGGAPRRVVADGSCPAWFPDGDRIVFDRGEELWTARLDGSEAKRVAGVPVNYFSFMIRRCAVVSPDGNRLAYYQPDRGPYGDFWLVAAAGGVPSRLTSDSAMGGGLAFMPDGRSVVFSSARRGSITLWSVGAAGGEPTPLTTGTGEDDEPDVARDGSRIAYSNSRTSRTLVLFDPKRGARRPLLERRSHLDGPSFSPGGERVAFFSSVESDGLEKLFVVGTDGQGLRQLAGAPGEGLIMPAWSADATTLFFYRDHPRPALMRIPVAGGPAELVYDGWRFPVQNFARPDPAGRTLLYVLFDQGAVKATRLRDLRTGQERSLERPIDWARWSRDGRRIVGSAGREVVTCSVADGRCTSVGEGSAPCWSGDGRRIYAARNMRGLEHRSLQSLEVWVMGDDGRDARRVALIESQHVLSLPFDVSVRDELVWPEVRRGRQELWLAELGRR
jgi:serine/threonine protein kinase/WD40 repeat protein